MKRTIVITLAVAILGVLGRHEIQNRSSSSASPPNISHGATTSQNTASYKDGTYDGADAETPYGNVQIAIVISSGKISDVKFLKMPHDEGRSIEITSFSEPKLKSNAISAQSANIDFVTGATSTSYGYKQSLQAALDRAAA